MTADHLDELMVVQREGAVAGLGHLFPQDTHPFPTERVRARWREELADPAVHCFVVVGADGEVAGFAATRGDELLHLGTALRTWGSGLAGRAHDELLDHLRRRGHEVAWLRVFDENLRAVRFYRRRGWVPTDETSRTSFPPHPMLRRLERALGIDA
jgi:RimJ/RimL family protein N-acetyltransferase